MTWLDGQWDDAPSPDPGPLVVRGSGMRVTWNFNPPPPPQMHTHIQYVERQVGKTLQLQNFLASLGASPVTTESEPEDPAPNSKYRENAPRFSPTGPIFDRRGRKRY